MSIINDAVKTLNDVYGQIQNFVEKTAPQRKELITKINGAGKAFETKVIAVSKVLSEKATVETKRILTDLKHVKQLIDVESKKIDVFIQKIIAQATELFNQLKISFNEAVSQIPQLVQKIKR